MMIEAILPRGTVAVDTLVDPPGAALYAEEEAIVRKAVAKRRDEFTTARWCARQAMARLGRKPAPVLPGPQGEPRWPAGLVGSITHCAGYRAAVLAESRVLRTVGVDAEPDEPLAFGVLEAVASATEQKMLAALAAEHPRVSWDRLLFSAKESVYKAWFPLTSRWLDFEDAELTIDPVAGTFRARLALTAPRAPRGFDGRWLATGGLLLTAIAVPA